ncbi:MAG: hypothetical protein RLY70_1387 [Planctomycetota bacterium]
MTVFPCTTDILSVERPVNACESSATDKMSVVQRRRITTSDAHSATSAPDFLVYRRAVGDGRASKPQSRRAVEFRFQRRRTRCPSYKGGGQRLSARSTRARLPRRTRCSSYKGGGHRRTAGTSPGLGCVSLYDGHLVRRVVDGNHRPTDNPAPVLTEAIPTRSYSAEAWLTVATRAKNSKAGCQLPVASCQLPVVSCRLSVAGCQLSVASCQLPVVSCQLSVVSCQLSVASCRLSVVSCQLSVVSCQLSVVGCRLSVVGCRLPVVGCRWPVVGCRLSVVGCWLLVASCQLQVASCKLSVAVAVASG